MKFSMKKQSGLTFIEVLLSLAMITTLLFVIKPSVAQVWQHWQVQQTVNTLENAWQKSRVLALQTKQLTQLCGSSNGKQCDGNWQQYWLLQQNKKVLQVMRHSFNSAKIKLTSNLPTQKTIQFSALGTTRGQQGRFNICEHEFCKNLIFIRTGRLRVQ